MATIQGNNNDDDWVKFIIGTVGVIATAAYILLKIKTGI